MEGLWKRVSRGRTAVAAGLLLAVAAGVQPGEARAQDIGLPIGSEAPVITMPDLHGNDVDLGAYIGRKPVLLSFWARWCDLCAQLEPRIGRAHQRFGEEVEFFIVAVGVNQTQRAARRHEGEHAGRFLWDGDGRATRAFRAPTTSYVVVLDAAGRVAYTGTGGTQDIEGVLARVTGAAE